MSLKRKIYLYSIIFGVISLLFIFFIIPSLLNEVRSNSETFTSSRQELISVQREIDNIQKLRIAYQNRKDDLSKIDDIFVDADVPLHFINFLELNSQISQQEINIAFVPSMKEKDELWPSLFFQVSSVGSPPDFLEFLERLENSPYLIEIMSLNIKRLIQKDSFLPTALPWNVESSFLIKVFTKK